MREYQKVSGLTLYKKFKTHYRGPIDYFHGRVPLAHIHSHRSVLRVFPLDQQSENFILN